MSFENMVPFSCLTEDFPRIEQLLRTYQEVIIIRGDQPRYRLTEIPAADSAAGALLLPTEAEDEPSRPRRLSVQEKTVLRRKLDSIGKSVFVRYYQQFQNREDPLIFMEEDFTEQSKRARASCAAYLFRMGWEHHALQYIVDSGRTAPAVRAKAPALRSSI